MQVASPVPREERASERDATLDARPSQRLSMLTRAKLLFVLAAGVSFLFSVYLWFLVDREQGLFVGVWVPSILALGALLLGGREDES